MTSLPIRLQKSNPFLLTTARRHVIMISTKDERKAHTMKHYLFNDRKSGEDFIVGAETLEEAKEIAKENFSQPHFIGRISEFEAENSGLDEW